MSSAICFNFDQSKILSSGNGYSHERSVSTDKDLTRKEKEKKKYFLFILTSGLYIYNRYSNLLTNVNYISLL